MSPDILKEHAYIRVIADRARVALAAPVDTLTEGRWHSLFDLELRGLLSALKRHFGHEENGGYMADLIRRHPETEHKFADLFGQHLGMKQKLLALIERNEADADLDEVRSGFKEVLALLAAHEAAETELVQEAIQYDTGGGD